MSTWRVFTGLWQDGGFAWTDKSGLTWEQARDILRGELRQDLAGSDGCEDCASQFGVALADLESATPGQPVELAEIDGHDYLIVRDDLPVPRMEDEQGSLFIPAVPFPAAVRALEPEPGA